MILGDFHVHSIYCDGKNTPRELVLTAIEKGLKKIGIVAHSYLNFEPKGSLSLENKPVFIAEINNLKREFNGMIEIFCGVEQDLLSNETPDGFDYVIGSVHFLCIDGEAFAIDWSEEIFCDCVRKFFNGDFFKACEDYFENVIKVVEKYNPNIIGHFDIVNKFNEGDKLFDTNDARYIKAYKNAVDRLIEKNIPFEINVGAIKRGYRTHPYPSKDIIDYIKQKNGKLIMSSDAHDKESIAFQFDKWQKYL